VTPDSPYYTEEGRAGLFYAEAWLLTHYLILGKNMNGGALLNEFGKLLQEGAEEGEAFRKVFGDPKKMDNEVSSYARQRVFIALSAKTNFSFKEDQLPSTRLTEGQWAAFAGGFELSQRRPHRARPLLEQALKADPLSFLANENMGFLLFHEGKDKDAAQFFHKALAANPTAYLSAYYQTMLTLGAGTSDAELRALDSRLGDVLELNPKFGPAYVALSLVKVRLGKLSEARGLAARALQLEPTRAGYLLNYARIQHRMGEVAEAESIAHLVAKRWEGSDRDEALELLAILPRGRAPEKENIDLARALLSQSPDEKSARGTIESVTCSPNNSFMALKVDGQVMKFKFGARMAAGLADTLWYGSDHFNPCHHLEDSLAVVRYKPLTGDLTGELTSFAIRDRFPESPKPATEKTVN
jgi:tetratricopeptide (TPR) repeat protein